MTSSPTPDGVPEPGSLNLGRARRVRRYTLMALGGVEGLTPIPTTQT